MFGNLAAECSPALGSCRTSNRSVLSKTRSMMLKNFYRIRIGTCDIFASLFRLVVAQSSACDTLRRSASGTCPALDISVPHIPEPKPSDGACWQVCGMGANSTRVGLGDSSCRCLLTTQLRVLRAPPPLRETKQWRGATPMTATWMVSPSVCAFRLSSV